MTKPFKKYNLITNIFGRIWALWALISFVVTFLIIIGPSLLAYAFKNFKKGQEYFLAVARIWMRSWLFLIGCPLKVYGKENFKPGKNYIVIYNHNALLDVPLSAPFVPGANKTIAKDSFGKIPLFNLYYARGAVLVNRKSEKSRIKSFEDMKQVLADGMHICIYPEGTRNRTDQPIKKFYDGAFKLAESTGNEIIPCILTGTAEAMPIHKSFFLLPHRLKMYFQPAVETEGKSAEELKDYCHDLMTKEYIRLSPSYQNPS